MAGAQDTILFQGTAIGILSHTDADNFAFVASSSSVTRAAGDFTTLWSAGQFFRPESSVANKSRCFQIISVTASAMVLDVAPADEASLAMTLHAFDPAALMTDFDGPSSENPQIDVTHSLSTAREFKSGLKDNGSFSFNGNTVRGDAGYIALEALADNGNSTQLLVAASDRLGFKQFLGNVATLGEAGQIDGAVTFSASIRVSGAIVNSSQL